MRSRSTRPTIVAVKWVIGKLAVPAHAPYARITRDSETARRSTKSRCGQDTAFAEMGIRPGRAVENLNTAVPSPRIGLLGRDALSPSARRHTRSRKLHFPDAFWEPRSSRGSRRDNTSGWTWLAEQGRDYRYFRLRQALPAKPLGSSTT